MNRERRHPCRRISARGISPAGIPALLALLAPRSATLSPSEVLGFKARISFEELSLNLLCDRAHLA